MSSLGFFRTGETYKGSKGLALMLEGLSVTNQHAHARAIVIHAAAYVSDRVVADRGILGRSWGCPVVGVKNLKPLVEKIKGGSLLLAWIP